MKNYYSIKIVLVVFLSVSMGELSGQSWNFAKDEDGIKIYTRGFKNSSLKSYKGEVTFHAPVKKVCAMFGNPRNIEWWGPDFKNIKVLAYEPNKYVQFYYIFNMPWPLTDRDLVVKAVVKTDSVTGEYSVLSTPLLNVIPEVPGLVRITKYSQKWTVKPLDKGNVQVSLEGFVDPGGNVPAWLYNMLVTEMPLRTLRLMRARVLSNKPAN